MALDDTFRHLVHGASLGPGALGKRLAHGRRERIESEHDVAAGLTDVLSVHARLLYYCANTHATGNLLKRGQVREICFASHNARTP